MSLMAFRVSTGSVTPRGCWLWNQAKVAGGLETAEQDRLKLESDLMNWW